nr:tripartite tricarboxylate transporter TctB family protein [Halomonas socia]
MRSIDVIFATATMVLGIYIVYGAIGYGYETRGSPGAGFFPFWTGIGIIVLSAVNVLRGLRGIEIFSDNFDSIGLFKTAGIAVAIVVFILIAPYFGMLLASGFLVIAIGYIIQPKMRATYAYKLGTIGVIFPFSAYLIFSVFLNVNLVTGVLGF